MLSRAERMGRARRADWTVTVVGDDRELARAAMAGDREAFQPPGRAASADRFQLCYRFVGRQEEARDLAQDVFVRVAGPAASRNNLRFRRGFTGSA